MTPLLISELSVLVVEPSTVQRRIIIHALANASVRNVSEATTGRQAISDAQGDPPDLVISAFYLPDMTGAELILALRETPHTANVAFALVSSETRLSALDPVRQAGAVALLKKPFTDRELILALRSTLTLVDIGSSDLDEFDVDTLEVLIVDDSKFARHHVMRVLATMGISRFTEAQTGSDAFELINGQHFDLVVTDYNMPDMDGRELTEQIRQHSYQSSIPVLMVTSEDNDNRLAAVQQAGVSAICDKPFEPAAVCDLVRQILAAA